MGAPKQRWTSEEEAALRTGVAKHGVGNWRTILNDPELSSVLRYRSNVDLKDKWRNMNVTVTASSSRDKARTAVKKSRAAPKNNDHSAAISTVTSDADDEMVDAKPIASVSTEAWNTSTSKKSHSRLDNIIMEAIKNLNEPTGSHRTTIANYIEEQYWPPSDFDHLLSAKLKDLASSGKLIKVNRKYRIAPSSPRLEGRSPKMLLLEDVQKEPLKVMNDASKSITRSQVDAELARMATMTPASSSSPLTSRRSERSASGRPKEEGGGRATNQASKMQYKNLGRSGLRVSQLSYGAWVTFGNQLDVKEAKALLQACRDAGVNFFDNAEVYANGRAEEIMGQAIRDLGWRRSDVVISTKLFWGGQGPNDKGLSRKHIVEGLRGSLKRLDMDYVDVVYCHRPDASTPIEETVRAMNWVIDQGWAFYWGTSEWSAQQITEAWAVANRLDLVGPIVEQPEYNLFSRHKVESEFLPLYSTYGIGLTTWSPLASGVLTGKYGKGNIPADSRFALDNYKNLANRSLVDETLRKVNGLKPIAAELGVSLAQLSIAWCASNPNVSSVITGATKESQIVENMRALDVIPQLTPEVIDRIEAVVQSRPKRTESYR